MPVLHIEVRDKKATYLRRDGDIICCNSDYSVQFAFDGEWDNITEKTARFVWTGGHKDVVFTGDTCPVPVIHASKSVLVGVMTTGDSPICTTPAEIACVSSILDARTS